MVEYGVFNDEGCIEVGFYTLKDAQAAADQYRDRYEKDLDNGDPYAEAKELCPDHEEQPKDFCEECSAEEDEQDDEEEDEDDLAA